MRPRPTTLLVDYAGVLSRGVDASHRAWCESEAVEPAALERLLRAWTVAAANPVRLVETGDVSPDEFERELASHLRARDGAAIASRGLLARMIDFFVPNWEMVGVVRRAHDAGIETGLVTNSWGSGEPWREFGDIFDTVVVSCRVRRRKPDPEIYRTAAANVHADPAECVFVDDLARNVDGAIAVGMVGIHHRDAASTRAEVAEALGVRL